MTTSTGTTTVRFTGTPETVGTTRLVRLPEDASRALPSRGQVAVTGTLDGEAFETVVEPDGRRGHWVRLPDTAGDAPVELELAVAEAWPEPEVPADLAGALDEAPQHIRDVWEDITPMARWEWVRWVGATRSAETRAKRVGVSIDKIDHGKRRPCCFDLSSCTDPDVARSGKLPEPS
ncbi:YdeI/OmpD-associated family protein [Phycicoccus jejuensis]|uniref:YdeI/OmpD-associated family protein n=1 Tax=Phycicoccus jejuensis TaxID=367299 RepID=UPI0004C3C303|nr:YdeI/OmpD-associated family protein [Phycicoccus jejuensis]